MRVRVDSTTSNPDITVPRPVSRQKSYKSRFGQPSVSSDSSSCSSSCFNSRIDEEEGEDNDMVLGGPSEVLDGKINSKKQQTYPHS